MTKEQKCVGEFFYFKYFSRGVLWRITFWELFDAGTWQCHKEITNKNTGKCWHTLRDWCFVINTVQLFCINDRIWFPINSTEGQSVILAFAGFCRLMKGVAKQNIIFLEFYISQPFYWYIVCVGFLEKSASTNFFLMDTCEGLQ